MRMREMILSGAAATVTWGLYGAAPATAQTVDCRNPLTQIEMGICAQRAFEAADEDLNADYFSARAAMREMDKVLEEEPVGAEKKLLEAQRLWIKYRDSACQAEGFLVRGGSMERLVVSSCMERVTRERSEMLRRLYEVN